MKLVIKTCAGIVLIFWGCLNLNAQEKKIIDSLSTADFVEFSPTISADGNTLIYETDKGNGWELYESRKDSAGNWGTPVPLTAINDKCDFIAGPGLSYDGNLLYYTAFIEGVTESEDIFYSKRLEGEGWSEPISLGAPINTYDYEAFPSISADGNDLYFIRLNYKYQFDKPSQENCFTIYVSHKIDEQTWGEPTPLPAPINMKCERDPKIMADNRTLIFSSIRDGGKGKFDMYQTRLRDDGTWEEPKALDFINSIENDQSPCISASGDIMYYYSNNDIYSIGIPEEFRQLINVTVGGNVVDRLSQMPVPVQIIVVQEGNEESESVLNNSPIDGRFSLVMGAGKKFKVKFVHPDYLEKNLDFDFSSIETYKEIKQNVEMESNYTALFSGLDLELKKSVAVYLSLKDSAGVSLFQDTIPEGASKELLLSTKQKYQISATAIGYEKRDSSLVFTPPLFKETSPILVAVLKEKIMMSVNVNDLSTDKKMRVKVYFNNKDHDETIIAESGESVSLRRGDRYEVLTSSDKGYAFASTNLIAEQEEGKAQPTVELKVARIEKGSMLTLNYITFETNSAKLDSSSYFELDRVIELLKANKKIILEVAAHTDDVGDEDYNRKLSEERAQSVVQYLFSNGIEKKQVVPIGYGEMVPLVSNEDEDGRAKNRRVELKVLE